MSVASPIVRPLFRPLFRSVFRGSAFDPLSLFANGEQGAFYLPEPQYLYQDSAETIPVTADGDPVGLMLDKSQGLRLGTEQVANGGFDADTDWTKESVWTIAGGVAQADGSTAGNIYQPGILTIGKRYKIKFGVTFGGTEGEALTLRFNPDGANVWAREYTEGDGTVELNIEATGVDFVIRAGWLGTGSFFSGTIDNVSVKELAGNHAAQSASASKRLYRTDGTLNWLEDDLFDDAITANLPDLGTNATLAYADGSGVTILTGQTISGDTNLPTVAETYSVIYLDRPLTADETAAVTKYLNKLRGA
ncbi:hypothetical protein [Marinobacter pelagius]|uniref:Uncharacterized protein n=1 Tax=Marinobacter pelagius TaxID=379482 RepID=A0A1I4T4U8_9GAMM|nr:hypothetical protein [Marinobacter pelagius]SFM71655.1 hypothetical protein SAMN04487961_0999 [Marinobacter pelagius]